MCFPWLLFIIFASISQFLEYSAFRLAPQLQWGMQRGVGHHAVIVIKESDHNANGVASLLLIVMYWINNRAATRGT